MRIKHYTLIVAFLAISMGIPLVQGCSDPFDEYGNGGTEMPVRDGWTSVSMSVEGDFRFLSYGDSSLLIP